MIPISQRQTREQRLMQDRAAAMETNSGLKRDDNWRKLLYDKQDDTGNSSAIKLNSSKAKYNRQDTAEDQRPDVLNSYRKLLRNMSAE